MNVTLSPASRDLFVPEDMRVADVIFDAQVSGAATTPIIPNIAFNPAHLIAKDGITSVGGNYRVSLSTVASIPLGASGQVTFRLCADAGCNVVYPGSTQIFKYTVKLQLLDWSNFQRDARQTGYVPLIADPSRFLKLWEWSDPIPRHLMGVATSGDQIFLTSFAAPYGNYSAKLYALDAADGTLNWSYDFGEYHTISAPATARNKVFLTTHIDATIPPVTPPGNSTGHFWCIDQSGPTVRCKHALTTVGDYGSPRVSPTPIGDVAVVVAGASNARLMAVNLTSGALSYDSPMGHSMTQGAGVAAAGNRAFVYSGPGLQVWDVVTGSLEFTISDPLYDPSYMQIRYFSTPVITSHGDVVALSGPADSSSLGLFATSFSGRRPLVSYDIANRTVRWKTTEKYLAPPVVANGVLYLTDYDQRKLTALDELTGAVLWTWSPPPPIYNAPFPNSYFMGPIIAIRNMVLVSTHDRIYAVDTITHQTVWSYDHPGIMAVTRTGVLLILEAYTDAIGGVLTSNGNVVAFQLN